MAIVTLPKSLIAGTPENVNDLNANLVALRDGINAVESANIVDGTIQGGDVAGGTLTASNMSATFAKGNVEDAFSTYKTVLTKDYGAASAAGPTASGKYHIGNAAMGGGMLLLDNTNTAATGLFPSGFVFRLDPAWWNANNRSTKCRIVHTVACAKSPGGTFSAGLQALAAIGYSGNNTYSISGTDYGTGATVTPTGDNGAWTTVGPDFTVAANNYTMAVYISLALAANSVMWGTVQLQVRQV